MCVLLLLLWATLALAQPTVSSGPSDGSVGPASGRAPGGSGGPVSAKDTFERAGPALGAPWGPAASYLAAPPVIVNASDVFSASVGSVGQEAAVYTALPLPSNDTYACTVISGTGTQGVAGNSSMAGACLIIDGVQDSMCCVAQNGSSAQWLMTGRDNGTTLGTLASAADPIAAGDTIAIKRTDATTFQCYKATAAAPTTWVALGTGPITQANIAANGAGGLFYYWTGAGGAATNLQIEAWETGTGALPTTHACGA